MNNTNPIRHIKPIGPDWQFKHARKNWLRHLQPDNVAKIERQIAEGTLRFDPFHSVEIAESTSNFFGDPKGLFGAPYQAVFLLRIECDEDYNSQL